MDVGYGDAILIEFSEGYVMMIDAAEEEYAEKIIIYLKSLGLKKIDTAILTHPHKDHWGGIVRISHQFPIGRCFLNGDDARADDGYEEMKTALEERNIPTITLRRDDTIDLKLTDVDLRVLNSDGSFSGSVNDDSIVSYLTFGQTSFLFTADIGPERQKEIIGMYSEVKEADCVQVPHHGGRLSKEYVETFQNKIFIVSTGVNEYKRPFEEELGRLTGRVLRTDQEGTITVESDGKEVRVVGK